MIFIGYVETETDKALFFQDHFWQEPGWMPKSQIDIFRENDTIEIVIDASDWICGKKGIQEFEAVPPF